jgi:hypothetical protein
MSHSISLPVNEISDADRRSLEGLLGQTLAPNQQVFVMVSAAAQMPDDTTRQRAVESIRRTLEKIDRFRAASRISDEEFSAAVDEAMEVVRPRPG